MPLRPLIIARTGDAESAPENTLAAVERASRKGADGVKCDIHLTTDGEVIVHHFYNLGHTEAHCPLLMHARKAAPRLRRGAFFHPAPAWMPPRLVQRHIMVWAEQMEINVIHRDFSLLANDVMDPLHEHNFTACGSNLDSSDDMQNGLGCGIDSFSTGRLGLALQRRGEFVTSRCQPVTLGRHDRAAMKGYRE
jgi:glycerophosphoryl diester phosphodiesterase